MTHVEVAQVGGQVFEPLRAQVRGQVLAPGDDGYNEARAVWNGMIDKHPAVIVRAAGVADVIDAVGLAREHGLIVTVRGGGHGVAGNALSDGGLVVDLSLMKGVRVDAAARTVRAEGGATLGDLDRETQAFGLAVPLGVVSKTGIAGLTLSGGMGWLRRRHGLAADNLVSLDVVTADGRFVTASEDENAELFWALRGGGGSFGVVTSFEYRAHPIGPDVFVAFVLYPGNRAGEVLRFADEFTSSASDDVSPLGFVGRVPHAEPFPPESQGDSYVALAAVFLGAADDGEHVLAPLRELGGPIVDLSGVLPYREAQSLLDEDYPDGWRYYWKSVNLESLGDEVLERIVAHADTAPSHHSTIDVWYQGGALERVDAEATAFGARPRYLIGVESNWEPGDLDEENIAWARAVVADLEPFSDGGGYLNFPGLFEEGVDQLRASYGERNFERLVALKNELDSGNVFGGAGAIRATA